MHFIQNKVYHIYNRGNRRERIFFNEENYQFFLRKLATELKPVSDILCWCLMPNHFHLIVHANENSCKERVTFGQNKMQELPFKIGRLLGSYSRAINNQNHTVGSLFQQKTKSKILTSNQADGNNNYLINTIHYCHQNPWRAGLVKKLEDWPYSSFRDYCGMRNHDMCNKQLLFELTGYSMENFYDDSYGNISGYEF